MFISKQSLLLSVAALACASAVTYEGDNPIKGKALYVNPSFQQELDTSIATSTGAVQANLKSMRDVSSAYWLDVRAKVKSDGTPGETASMEGILKDAASKKPVPLVTLIVYDLPNRDCHARASNGEICCTYKDDGTCDYIAPGNCEEGIETYKKEYIDPLVEVLSKYQSKVPIVLIIEPDSLPNLATNLANPRCGSDATMNAYHTGISYAVDQIAKHAPQVTMYLDAAHGGWLGWVNSLETFVETLKGLDVNVFDKIRGFATNTANYQSVGVQCAFYDYCLGGKNADAECCADPCKLTTQYNAGNNELNYVLLLHNKTASAVPGFDPKFVIDTGRNGVGDMRESCSNWCNIRNAGVGLKPTTETGSDIVDAYLWLKTPGESDGCTDVLPDGSTCPRYDSMCGSEDSLGSEAGETRAPEAGHWFDYQIKQLAANAKFE